MKIGIFGGSFNPPHNGHRRALLAFKAPLDKVLVIPSYISPHKSAPHLTPLFEHRLEMSRLAFGDIEGVEVSDIEKRLYLENGEKSYTKNTLEALMREWDAEWHLFVGTDMFTTLDEWREAEWLFKNAVIDVMSRDGDDAVLEEFKEKFEKRYGAVINIIKASPIPLSSTEVREKMKGEGSDGLIDDEVSRYIEENALYKKRASREEILSFVKERLSPERFSHTLSVEKEALLLASETGFQDTLAVSEAALLHDVAKHLSTDEQISVLKKFGTAPGLSSLKSPKTLHALTGSVIASENFTLPRSVTDAILYHTTGRADMTPLEAIIFVSDFTEETRRHEACLAEREKLHREISKKEILNSVKRILESTIRHLNSKGEYIHPLTLEAFYFYNKEEKDEAK